MTNNVKFGIIGCSDIAKRKTIPAMLNSKNVSLHMIGSRSKEKAKEWAHEFKINEFGSYDDVLENKNLDAVYISLPFSLQAEWAIKAAKKGKHILCEKSTTTSFTSAKLVVETARKNNVRILEAFMFRFHPQHKKFKELIKNGIAGDIFQFESKFGLMMKNNDGFRFNKKLGGSALNDVGCYPVCASRMFFEQEPLGVMSSLIFDKINGIDTQGSFFIVFPNNKIALGSFSYNNFYQSIYSVWGTKSSIGLKRAFAIKPDSNTYIWIKSDDGYNEIEIPWNDQSQLMIEDFCDVITGNSKSSFDYESDLLNQAKTLEAIRISNHERRFVKLEEIS